MTSSLICKLIKIPQTALTRLENCSFLIDSCFLLVLSSVRSLRRQGQPSEKVNRGVLLAPLVGIILNLLEASEDSKPKQHDVIGLFASMDCPDTVYFGFQYLLEYNWVRKLLNLVFALLLLLLTQLLKNIFRTVV